MIRLYFPRSLSLALAAILIIAGCLGVSAANAATTDSLTLSEAIRLAEEHAPLVEQATAQADAAAARTKQAKSSFSPTLDAAAGFTRIDPVSSVTLPLGGKTETFSFAPNNNYNADLGLHYTIFDFGKRSALVDAVKAAESSANDNVHLIATSIFYQTVQAFYSALVLQENIGIEEEQIKTLRENLAIAQERLKFGTGTNYDVLTSNVRISQIAVQETDIRNALQKQIALLRRLTGLPVSREITVATNTDNGAIAHVLGMERPNSIDSLLTVGSLQREEILLAKDQEHSAELEIAAAKHGDDPSLGLNVTGGVKNGYLPNLNNPQLNWVGALQVSVPIFSGGRTSAKVEEAEANLRAAQAHTRDIERSIALEIEQAQADRLASVERVQSVLLQLQQSREALNIARVRFQAGTITNTEFLNSQTALEQSEFLKTQSDLNVILARANLERALGTTLQ